MRGWCLFCTTDLVFIVASSQKNSTQVNMQLRWADTLSRLGDNQSLLLFIGAVF